MNASQETSMEQPGRLLLADDEELVLLATADLLRQEGYLVDCAADGAEALLRLRGAAYDVLISDINMPGNADLGLLRDLPEPNAGLPVILVTGYPSAATAIRAVNFAALAYLVKPVDFQELLGHVRRAVAQRRVQLAALASAQRFQAWAGEMAELALALRTQTGTGGMPVQSLLRAMLGRMGETLLDLKHLIDLTPVTGQTDGGCPVQHCPRLEMYQQIFHEGIGILEKTKGAFKSKNLEYLRQKMEGAMENRPGENQK